MTQESRTKSSSNASPRRLESRLPRATIWPVSIASARRETSNKDCESPQDPDARVTKMKDGRTHLAHTVEHAVDMETGVLLA